MGGSKQKILLSMMKLSITVNSCARESYLLDMPYFLPHAIPDPILHSDPDLLIDLESNVFLYKGRKLSKKRRFEYVCKCGVVGVTTQNLLTGKQNPLSCRSCSSVESWKKSEYRNPRAAHLRALASSEANRERGKNHFTKLWNDEQWRKKILEKLHSEETRKKQSETIRSRLTDDEEFRNDLLARSKKWGWGEHCDYESKDGKIIHLRSRGEKRFASLLDKEGIKWEYEKKGFHLKETNEFYYPDFYIPDLDLWVEIKYLLRERDLRKFRLLESESKNINLLALGHKHINLLERECGSQKLKQVILSLFEISRSSKTTIL